MFTLALSETFKAKVKVNVAMATGGWKEESFTGIFKRTPDSERERLLNTKYGEVVREVLVGWEMQDESRQAVEFNDQNLEAFLQLTGAVRETATVYFNHNAGAKEKN